MSRASSSRLLVAGVLAPLVLVACSPFEQGCVDEGDGAAARGPTAVRPAALLAMPPPDPDLTMYATDADLDRSGERLVVRCDGRACLWDTSTGELLDTDLGASLHTSWAGEEDDVLAGTSYDSGEEQGEVVLTATEGADAGESCVLRGHDIAFATDGGSGIAAMTVSPDGTLLATGAGDGRVGLWSVTDRERVDWLEPDQGYPSALAFSPDGATLAVGGRDAPVELWDVEEREATGELDGALREVAWSPDGDRLAGVDLEGALLVVDVDDGSVTTLLSSDAPAAREVADVGAIAWSPDGERVAFTDVDGPVVRTWDVASGEVTEVARHDEVPESVLWAPDGEALYSVDGVDGVRRTPFVEGEPSGEAVRFETPEPIAG